MFYELAVYRPGVTVPYRSTFEAGCNTEAEHMAHKYLRQLQQPYRERALRTPPRGKRKLTRAQRKDITANISQFHVNVGRIA